MKEITIYDLAFTEDERNLIISHWLKDYVLNGKYFLLDCVMNDMTCNTCDPRKFIRTVSILGRESYSVAYIKFLDETIISFLMGTPLGQKTFENLPEQIKNKALANSL